MLTSECKRRDEMSPNTAEKNGGNIVKCTVRAEKIDESPGAWRVLKFSRERRALEFIEPVSDLPSQRPINGGGSGTPQRFSPDAPLDFVDMPSVLYEAIYFAQYL